MKDSHWVCGGAMGVDPMGPLHRVATAPHANPSRGPKLDQNALSVPTFSGDVWGFPWMYGDVWGFPWMYGDVRGCPGE